MNLLDKDFYVLDCETTGLDRFSNEPVQIALIHRSGIVVCNTLVCPFIEIEAGAVAVHGLTKERLKDAPIFHHVYHAVLKRFLTENDTIVAYNADFDRAILESTMERQMLPVLKPQWSCAMRSYARFLARTTYAALRWQTLTNACLQQGIPIDDAHDALADAKATLALIYKMSEKEE